MNKRTKIILISIIVIVFSLIIGYVIRNSFALHPSTADTQTYFNTGRTSGVSVVSSNDVIKDGVIPAEYSFALGKSFDSYRYSGDIKISDSDVSLLDGPYLNTYNLSVCSDIGDSIKGNFNILYENAGTYDGKNIDIKTTVMDFDYNYSSSNSQPRYICFYGAKNKIIGIALLQVNWIELKYEFFESGTNTPINVKGYTSYWDVDWWQGIHFLDGNATLYTSSNSALSISKINSKNFIYDDLVASYNEYDTKGIITETFEGTEINRVFSVASPSSLDTKEIINYRDGIILNESIVNTALKTYASDSNIKSGAKVRVNDIIKYNIQYTNGDANNAVNVTIEDTLSKGLEYVSGSSTLGNPTITNNTDGTTKLVWTTSLNAVSSSNITYSAKVVEGYENGKVSNGANVTIGDKIYNPDPLINNVIPQYTVTYESDENGQINGIENEKIYENGTPTGTTERPNTGYNTKNWTCNKDVVLKDGTPIQAGSPITGEQIKNIEVTEDITLTVHHEKIKYVVTYQSDENGQISGIENENINYNENPSGTTERPNTGYNTKNWTCNKNVVLKDGTPIQAGSPITREQIKNIEVTEAITLTVHHEKAKYRITYELDGGNVTGNPNEYTIDDEINIKNPTKEGYNFKGWTGSNGEEASLEVNIPIGSTGDKHYVAHYERIEYKIEYESNGGTPVDDETVEYKGTATKPADPTREGYTFKGWYTEEELENQYDFATEITENKKLYAKWEKIPDEKPTPEEPEKEEPKPEEKHGSEVMPEKNVKEVPKTFKKAVQTGLISNIAIYVAMLVIAIVSGVAVIVVSKKRENIE